MRRFPALDGLRAISILLVLVWHVNASLWSGLHGGLGVTIFFVISGFLITTLCLREEATFGRVSLSAFYARRAFRILPLYYLVLAGYVVVYLGLNWNGHENRLTPALPYYLSYMNDFAPLRGNTPFAQSWSLGVEEKFYLLWPALAFVVLIVWPRFRIPIAAGLALAPFVLLPFHVLPWLHHYSSIMVGCLLALLLHDERGYRRLRHLASPRGAAIALAVLVALHVALPAGDTVHYAYPFAVAAVMVSLVLGRMPWSTLLAHRSMRFLGILAYGVYLVHLIVINVLVAGLRHLGFTFGDAYEPLGGWLPSLALLALAAIASFGIALMLNRTVEAPMIAVGRKVSARFSGGREAPRPERVVVGRGPAGEVAAP